MASYRIIKRGVLFGNEGEVVTRADFAEEVDVTNTIANSGKPVPVIFGTRYIEPTVVNWSAFADRVTSYYSINRSAGTARIRDYPEEDIENIRMVVLSMRMVLCVGGVDRIGAVTVEGIPFALGRQSLPDSAASGSRNTFTALKRLGADRLVVPAGDADIFGGIDGGLGFPFGRVQYNTETSLSELWLSSGDLTNYPYITNLLLDKGSAALGLTTLTFIDFNFGGKIPLAKWRLGVTRINAETERDERGIYYRQWQPDLAEISTLPAPQSKTFYMFVLDRTINRTQRGDILLELTYLSFDERTSYQIIYLGYFDSISGTVLPTTASPIINSRSAVLNELRNYVNQGGINTRGVRVTNWSSSHATVIRRNYVSYMQANRQNEIPNKGVIVIYTTDIFGNDSKSNLISSLNEAVAEMSQLKFPRGRTDSAIIQRYPPEIRLIIWRYADETLAGGYFGGHYFRTEYLGDSEYRRFDTIDSYSTPINHGTIPIPISLYLSLFSIGNPFGKSMNPIHALREALVNRDWGEGIPVDKIDNGAFLLAATTCHSSPEQLDYCYIYDKLGGVDKLIDSILNYIDGVLYYEAATDKVRVKLIREDYSLTSIPAFDESNIAKISRYQRQHGDESVNSVTIKYHDAANGSDETVTVHNLEAVHRQKGVVAITLNYEGCATKAAAIRVAERELFALSKSLISFTATLNPSEILGLGDAVIVSWRDLGVSRIVMRVSKIDYGDGLKGGVDVELIQDVFADLNLFGDLIGDEPLPDDTPALIDLQTNILFLEASKYDLTSIDYVAQFTANANARFIKAGLKHSNLITDDTVVTIAGQKIGVGIAKLLDDIPELTFNPDTQSIPIYIQSRVAPVLNQFIRIDDEVFLIGSRVTKINDTLYEIIITKRAQHDTVSHAHARGSDIWLLDKLYIDTTPWDGSPVISFIQQGVHTDRELLTPSINFVGRANRPLPPAYVTVQGRYTDSTWVDGDIHISFQARPDSLAGQETYINLYHGAILIYATQVTLPVKNMDIYPIQNERIGVSAITSAASITGTDANLTLYVGGESAIVGKDSWQSWKIEIDWSSRDRTTERQGWNFNWGNDWGGGNASGFGYDWGNDWGD